MGRAFLSLASMAALLSASAAGAQDVAVELRHPSRAEALMTLTSGSCGNSEASLVVARSHNTVNGRTTGEVTVLMGGQRYDLSLSNPVVDGLVKPDGPTDVDLFCDRGNFRFDILSVDADGRAKFSRIVIAPNGEISFTLPEPVDHEELESSYALD